MAHWLDEDREVMVKMPYNTATPLKARRVINQLRGKTLREALEILRFMPQSVAVDLYKLSQNALNAARQKAASSSRTLNENQITITEIYADQGPRIRRFRPTARGRAHRIDKTASHLVLIIDLGDE
jgi:large subunit ribosomal protein L22